MTVNQAKHIDAKASKFEFYTVDGIFEDAMAA